MSVFNESTVEEAALDYLRGLGYTTAFGPNLAPDGSHRERTSFEHVYLYDRLRDAAASGLDVRQRLPQRHAHLQRDHPRQPLGLCL